MDESPASDERFDDDGILVVAGTIVEGSQPATTGNSGVENPTSGDGCCIAAYCFVCGGFIIGIIVLIIWMVVLFWDFGK